MKLRALLLTLGLLSSLLLSAPVFADNEELCFNKSDSLKMIVIIEQVDKLKEYIAIQQEALQLQEKRLKSLEDIDALRTKQIEVLEDSNKRLISVIDIQKKAYDAIKPSFFDTLKTMSFGAVIASIAILLLL